MTVRFMSAAQLAVQRRGVEKAIVVLGSAQALAELIEVRPQFISQVRSPENLKLRIAAESCPRIELRTRLEGQPVLCEEIRPDVDWYVLLTRPRKRFPKPGDKAP